jgi:hypothetical protein
MGNIGRRRLWTSGRRWERGPVNFDAMTELPRKTTRAPVNADADLAPPSCPRASRKASFEGRERRGTT